MKKAKTHEELMHDLERDRQRREKEFQRSLVEPLWYLRSIPYSQYRQSHHWAKRSEAFRATFECPQCEVCGLEQVHDDSGNLLQWVPQFHVHHTCYQNLGCENDSDLKLVCSACHNLIHFPDSQQAKFWLEFNPHICPLDLISLCPQWNPVEETEAA